MQRPEKFTPERIALSSKVLEGVATHLTQAIRSLAAARALMAQGVREQDMCSLESAMRTGIEVRLVVAQESLGHHLGVVQTASRQLDALRVAASSPAERLLEMDCLTGSKQ